MTIRVPAFALAAIALACGNVPAAISVGDVDGQTPQEELSVLRHNLQQAKQKIDDLERQVAGGNLENAKRRIGELILQLHAKDTEIAALRSSAHENSKKLRDDLASQTEELNLAKRRVAEVEQQMAVAGKGQDLIQAKRRAADAEQQTARKEQELAQVKRRIAEVEQQMAGKEQELAQAKRRMAEADQQTTGKEQELAQAKRRAADAEQQIAGKEQELALSKRRMAEADQQTTGKEQELAQAKRRAADAEQQIARKEQELALFKRRMAEADQQTTGKEQELAQAKRRAADAEQQIVRKEQELAQARRRIAEVEQQIAGKDQDPAQAKRRAADAEQQMAGRELELAQAKRRAAEAEQLTTRKEQELAQIKDDLKQVTQKLADLKPQLVAQDAELARTKQLLADLERNPSKQTQPAVAHEESSLDKNSLPPQSVEEHLSVANLLPSVPPLADEAEALLSSDLGKMSESLASLLQPELKKGNVTLKQRGDKLTLAFAAGELFTPGDATVTLGGTSLLERVGTVLHGFRYQSVEVAGHTDNMPVRNDARMRFRDNIALSKTRAEHASQALVNGGLEADRVKTVGYADTKPLAPNDTEKGRSKNRRVEIVITQWSESGGNFGDAKTQVGKKLQGFTTQTVTHR